jgi:alpha-1,6-mannosyltransferase
MNATATNLERAAPPPRSTTERVKRRPRPTYAAWLWGALGLAGSVVLTLSGTHLLGRITIPKWWFAPALASSHLTYELIFYAGVAGVVVAWLGLGYELRRSEAIRLRHLFLIGALWCLPLALGPPLFSRDVYSYLAQGTILHLGRNPYHVAPIALAHLGQQHTLDAISGLWRTTTAPYGPLFLTIVGWFVGAAAYKLVLGAILVRLLAILGVALIAVALPPLAKRLGGDPRRAVWLMALSPLVLFQLVSPAHNDILMAGVMAVGVAVALRWPLLGIAICALAATIKVPAAAAAAFIAVAWAWQTEGAWNRVRVLAGSAAVFGAVIAVVSAATGVGLSWISSGLFSTPGKVHLAITPATALGYTTASVLRDAGVAIGGHTLAELFSRIIFGLTAVYGVWLLYRVRQGSLVRYLGVLLVVAAVLGPAAWPWYLVWGLPLLAACPKGPLFAAMPLVLVLGGLVVKPSGYLLLPIQAAPEMVAVYAAAAAVAVILVRRRRRTAGADGRPW